MREEGADPLPEGEKIMKITKDTKMDSNRRMAFIQVIKASNWVIGGYENAVMDGEMEQMPDREFLKEEIYDTVMTCTTGDGWQSFRPIKEIRFAGTEWIMERIENRLTKLGY